MAETKSKPMEILSLEEYIEGDYKITKTKKIIYSKSGRPYEVHGTTKKPLHPDPAAVKRVLETAARMADWLEQKWARESQAKKEAEKKQEEVTP